MKKVVKAVAGIWAAVVMVFSATTVMATEVFAAEDCNGKFTETTLIGKDYTVNGTVKHGVCDTGDGDGIYEILGIVLNVLTYGVGAAGVLGIVICGVQYMTAAGNEAQMTKAKNRIIEVVIGLVGYGVLWAFLQWVIPGGTI